MIRSTFTRNVPLKLASIVLAFFLWLHVEEQASNLGPPTNIVIEVTPEGLPDNMVTIPKIVSQHVTLTAQFNHEVTAEESKNFKARVDLSRAKQGMNKVLVLFDPPPGTNNPKIVPRTLEIEVDTIKTARMKVDLTTSGLQPADLIYGGSTVSPEFVEIRGASRLVRSVRKVRAILNLAKLQPTTLTTVKLEPLDKDDKPVQEVECVPDEVTVRPALAPAPTTKNLIVTPSWEGQVPYGYRIASVVLSPNQIQVAGRSEVLASLISIETNPISIGDLTEDKTLETRIKLPAGTRAIGSEVIQVKITIERSPSGRSGN